MNNTGVCTYMHMYTHIHQETRNLYTGWIIVYLNHCYILLLNNDIVVMFLSFYLLQIQTEIFTDNIIWDLLQINIGWGSGRRYRWCHELMTVLQIHEGSSYYFFVFLKFYSGKRKNIYKALNLASDRWRIWRSESVNE